MSDTRTGVRCLRVSTGPQATEGEGLDAQRMNIDAYAARNNITIIDESVDEISGDVEIWNRPGGKRIYEYLNGQRKADCLIFSRLDRVTRDADFVDIHIFRRDVKRAGIELHYADRGKSDPSAFGSLLDHFFAITAAEERATIRDRLLGGKMAKVARGQTFVAGRPPYGYSVMSTERKSGEKRREWLIVNEDEARYVRLLFEWYALGELVPVLDANGQVTGRFTRRHMSIIECVLRLNQMGVPARGDTAPGYRAKRAKGWSHSTVYNILKNEAYIGRWAFRKYFTEPPAPGRKYGKKAPYPREKWLFVPVAPILVTADGATDVALFNAVQHRFEENRVNSRRNRRNDYLLTGHLRCGFKLADGSTCGRTWQGRTQKNKFVPDHHTYICAGNQRLHGERRCQSPEFNGDALEEMVWVWVREMILNPDYIRACYDELGRDEEADRALVKARARVAEIATDMAQLDRQRSNLVRLARSGRIYDDEFDAQANDIAIAQDVLAMELSELERTIAATAHIEQAIAEFEVTAAQVRAGIDNATFEDKREYLKLLDMRLRLVAEGDDRVAYARCILFPGEKRFVVPLRVIRPKRPPPEPAPALTPLELSHRMQKVRSQRRR